MTKPEPTNDARLFETWFTARVREDGNPAGVLKLREILHEAFDAGLQAGRADMLSDAQRLLRTNKNR